MKLTDVIEATGIKQVVIAGSKYYRPYISDNFTRYPKTGPAERLTGEQMAFRVRKLIASGKWRLWIDGDTLNLVKRVE